MKKMLTCLLSLAMFVGPVQANHIELEVQGGTIQLPPIRVPRAAPSFATTCRFTHGAGVSVGRGSNMHNAVEDAKARCRADFPGERLRCEDCAGRMSCSRDGEGELFVPQCQTRESSSGLPEAVIAALERAEGSAPAADVLREAGIQPGSLTREQVLAAFEPQLGAERAAALAEKFDREPLGADATVEELTLRAAEGEKVAGPVLLAAAAVAMLAALTGCGTMGEVGRHTEMCRGYGLRSIDYPGMRSMAISVARGEALARCERYGCSNCRVTDVNFSSRGSSRPYVEVVAVGSK